MVGNATHGRPPNEPQESLAEALRAHPPRAGAVRDVGDDPVYLVGGAVRDLLLGRGRADIDLVVEGDAAALAARLGADVVSHERFGTAKVKLDGHEVDIAGARSESYPHPGALPVVEPAAELEADLLRRDFTINAMAIPLARRAAPDRPARWRGRPGARQLRVLHTGSFVDDPTRALRAARYAARFGFELEAEHGGAASRGGPGHGLGRSPRGRAAAPGRRRRGAARVCPAGRVGPGRAARRGALSWSTAACRAARSGSRGGTVAPRDRALLAAALGPPRGEEALAEAQPDRPSEAVALAAAQRRDRARPRPRSRRRVARSLPERVARRRPGDRRRGPDRGRPHRRARRSAGAWRRRCGASSTARSTGARRSWRWRSRRRGAAMEWREAERRALARGGAAGRDGCLHDPPRRRQRGALRGAQPRRLHRRRARRRAGEPPPPRRRARLRARADRDRPPGARRRADRSRRPDVAPQFLCLP